MIYVFLNKTLLLAGFLTLMFIGINSPSFFWILLFALIIGKTTVVSTGYNLDFSFLIKRPISSIMFVLAGIALKFGDVDYVFLFFFATAAFSIIEDY